MTSVIDAARTVSITPINDRLHRTLHGFIDTEPMRYITKANIMVFRGSAATNSNHEIDANV